ncbi:hypothetical protein QTP70_020389 [Hemibagrus guttatus]|uniref:Uncharacterized protein n=1 Tax=Hemibagrus guttatus TaxID=175788 RepID=A0AAE0QNP4_9TELE|nr:hypothetical protein QTP70_020389 [Hemibagrus guttatus]
MLHFCRYCEIDREAFLADPLAKGPDRTPQSDQKHVDAQKHNLEACNGVNIDSIFNERTYFHVRQPGLPPCIGHDLFEGIVSTDLALYLNYLVLNAKQFTFVELNRRINQFTYLGNDANSKPCEQEAEVTLRLIHLLMAYFDERTDKLILLADMSASATDAERTLNLPASPRLILPVTGNEVTTGWWMISIETQVICEDQSSFISGLAAVLATYYVFNLEYQEEAARTLEFVQKPFHWYQPRERTKGHPQESGIKEERESSP